MPLPPAVDEILTMDPPPFCNMCRISYFIHSHAPLRLVSIVRSHSSSVSSVMGIPSVAETALFTE